MLLNSYKWLRCVKNIHFSTKFIPVLSETSSDMLIIKFHQKKTFLQYRGTTWNIYLVPSFTKNMTPTLILALQLDVFSLLLQVILLTKV